MNCQIRNLHLDFSLLINSEDDRQWKDTLDGGVLTDSTNSLFVSESQSTIQQLANWNCQIPIKDSLERHLHDNSFKRRKSCLKDVDNSYNPSISIQIKDSSTKENTPQTKDITSKIQHNSAETNRHQAAMEGSWKRNRELLDSFQENIKDIDAKINQRLTLIKQQFWEQRARHKSSDLAPEPNYSRQADRKKSHLLAHLHRKPTNNSDCPKERFMKYIPMRELLTHGDGILTNQKIIHCKLMMQLQLERKSLRR